MSDFYGSVTTIAAGRVNPQLLIPQTVPVARALAAAAVSRDALVLAIQLLTILNLSVRSYPVSDSPKAIVQGNLFCFAFFTNSVYSE